MVGKVSSTSKHPRTAAEDTFLKKFFESNISNVESNRIQETEKQFEDITQSIADAADSVNTATVIADLTSQDSS